MTHSIIELDSVSVSQFLAALTSVTHLQQPRVLIRKPELDLAEVYWDSLALPENRQRLLGEREIALKHALFALHCRYRDACDCAAVCLGPAGAIDQLDLANARALAADVWHILTDISTPNYQAPDSLPDPASYGPWRSVPWQPDPMLFHLQTFYTPEAADGH